MPSEYKNMWVEGVEKLIKNQTKKMNLVISHTKALVLITSTGKSHSEIFRDHFNRFTPVPANKLY